MCTFGSEYRASQMPYQVACYEYAEGALNCMFSALNEGPYSIRHLCTIPFKICFIQQGPAQALNSLIDYTANKGLPGATEESPA